MKGTLLLLFPVLILYGLISVFATLIHETGHLLFAYGLGATNLSYNFNFLGASFANWTGAESVFTVLGGVIFSVFIGLPFAYVFFTTKSTVYIRIAMALLIVELISNSFFYIAISSLIKWGDGHALVESYSFNRAILFLICLMCGTLFSTVTLARLFDQIRTLFQKKFVYLFVLLFFSIMFTFRLLSKSFFVYTYDYILLLHMLITFLTIPSYSPATNNRKIRA